MDMELTRVLEIKEYRSEGGGIGVQLGDSVLMGFDLEDVKKAILEAYENAEKEE